MVNRGPSKGCHTCKRRRVKCDETNPTCKRCARFGVECEGYELWKTDKIIFKHHTPTIARRARLHRKQQPRLAVRDLCQHYVVECFRDLPADEESLAFGFFLNGFVAPGQDCNSTRGFFDNIIPALSTAHTGSPVFLAFSAVATQMYSQWCHGTFQPSGLPKMRLIQALERLQEALQDPVESKNQSTLMATLLLQFLDNVTSVQRLQIASRTHQNGALALARHQGRAGFDTPNSKYILYRLINVEVSSAIREGRPVPADLCNWCNFNDVPRSPSSDLDNIGINVADIQRTFSQTWHHHSRCKAIACLHLELFSEVCVQATAAEKDLIAWASDVPTPWTPFKFNLERLQKTRPPIQTYLGACDVYPSIQIASIWNSWRFYRLVALTTLLACVETFELASLSESSSISAQNVDRTSIRVGIQNIVDSICASVPFHVGNRVRRCSLEDFTNTSLDFPAYHCFLHDKLGLPDRMKHALVMPRHEHNRQVVAQGAWHIINPLSRILSLCSGPAGAPLASAIREGQLSWIQGQLRRCVTILGLDRERLDPGDPLTARHRLLLSDNLSVTVAR